MKLVSLEKSFVNSWIRSFMLRRLEAPIVLPDLTTEKRNVCLEIGCGRGLGLLLINQYIDCEKVIGIDLDPDMIECAKKFLSSPPKWAKDIKNDNIKLFDSDASTLNFPDQHFNAVILFGVLHHILDWKSVITEIYRVLKVGGVFSFVEEALMPSIFKNMLTNKESSFNKVFKYNRCLKSGHFCTDRDLQRKVIEQAI